MSLKCCWIDNRLDMFYFLICIIATPYSLASCLIRFLSLHTLFPSTSPRFLCITQGATLAVKTFKCPLLQRHFRDVALTPARIRDITLSQMTLAPAAIFYCRIGTRSRQKRSKSQNGTTFWVHTYTAVSSRPRERCVHSLVQTGSEMWICIRYKQTHKQTNKQTNKQTYTNKQIHTYTNKQTNTYTHKLTNTYTQTNTYTHKHIHTQTNKQTNTYTQTNKQTNKHIHTNKQTYTHTNKQTKKKKNSALYITLGCDTVS
jgi:hypothetical protein